MNDDHPTIPEPFEIPELASFYNWLGRIGRKIFLKDAGRNDPCPCGSGAKLKKCHKQFPLEDYRRVLSAINDMPAE